MSSVTEFVHVNIDLVFRIRAGAILVQRAGFYAARFEGEGANAE